MSNSKQIQPFGFNQTLNAIFQYSMLLCKYSGNNLDGLLRDEPTLAIANDNQINPQQQQQQQLLGDFIKQIKLQVQVLS